MTAQQPILAASNWPTNGELIADVAQLYLGVDDLVLDATFGRGLWWTKVTPAAMITNDIVPGRAEQNYDFRHLPAHWADSFDLVAYDPPYVCVGGRGSTGMADLHDRYGLTDAPKTPIHLQGMMDDGLAEMKRVTRPGGLILMKCQDYVSSGKLWNGTYWTADAAIRMNLEIIDRFEHISGVRPQPPGRGQVHARRNLSTLFVFRKHR